jgi:hypothetical protein
VEADVPAAATTTSTKRKLSLSFDDENDENVEHVTK